MHHVPHRFPFEWIDACEPGLARVHLTATGPFGRLSRFPDVLILEILAQGCLAGLAAKAAGEGSATNSQTGLLAGINQIDFHPVLQRQPLMAGDTLEVQAEQTASFGRLIKVHATLKRENQVIAAGDLMLAID